MHKMIFIYCIRNYMQGLMHGRCMLYQKPFSTPRIYLHEDSIRELLEKLERIRLHGIIKFEVPGGKFFPHSSQTSLKSESHTENEVLICHWLVYFLKIKSLFLCLCH